MDTTMTDAEDDYPHDGLPDAQCGCSSLDEDPEEETNMTRRRESCPSPERPPTPSPDDTSSPSPPKTSASLSSLDSPASPSSRFDRGSATPPLPPRDTLSSSDTLSSPNPPGYREQWTYADLRALAREVHTLMEAPAKLRRAIQKKIPRPPNLAEELALRATKDHAGPQSKWGGEKMMVANILTLANWVSEDWTERGVDVNKAVYKEFMHNVQSADYDTCILQQDYIRKIKEAKVMKKREEAKARERLPSPELDHTIFL